MRLEYPVLIQHLVCNDYLICPPFGAFCLQRIILCFVVFFLIAKLSLLLLLLLHLPTLPLRIGEGIKLLFSNSSEPYLEHSFVSIVVFSFYSFPFCEFSFVTDGAAFAYVWLVYLASPCVSRSFVFS